MVRLNKRYIGTHVVIYNSRNLMVRLNITHYDITGMIYNSRNLMVRLNKSSLEGMGLSTTVEI